MSPDAVPRVVLLGRLSLWGEGAARLHEEIVRVAARWVEPEIRKAPLRAYAREAERQTMDALDRALDQPKRFAVAEGVQRRLLAMAARDIDELLPELEAAQPRRRSRRRSTCSRNAARARPRPCGG